MLGENKSAEPLISSHSALMLLSTTTTSGTVSRPLRAHLPVRHRRLTRAHAESAKVTPKPNAVMKILYCTGNEGKFKEASFVFEEFNKRGGAAVEIVQVDADPVEIQGSAEEIGLNKVREAVRILKAKGEIPKGTTTSTVHGGGTPGHLAFPKKRHPRRGKTQNQHTSIICILNISNISELESVSTLLMKTMS